MNSSVADHYVLDDFFIVLVLYRISLEDSVSFKSLLNCNKEKEHLDMMVYDNSQIISKEKDSFNVGGLQIQYVKNPNNPGVSKAYNTGINRARQMDKKWVLFLDQDTNLDGNLLQLFLKSCNEQKDVSIFATTLFGTDKKLISPSRYFFKRGFSLSQIPNGKCRLKRMRPINSSVVVSMAVFEKVGLYNEAIRLDFSDHEFFDRANRYYENMYVVGSNSFHSLSSSDDTDVGGIKIRFAIFCEGAHVAGKKSFLNSLQYLLVCGLRGFRLSLKYRTLFFLNTLVKEWVK